MAAAASEQASTGIVGLDEVLRGGLPRDRIYLVQGDPGAGKTTLALQFVLAGAAAGERCLYITLSESLAEIEATAVSHGWSLAGLSVVEMSALEQSQALAQQNTLFETSEIELGETTRQLVEHIERVAPQRVVIDSLSEMRLLAQGPLRYRRQILDLKQQFAGKRCTVLFLDDRTSDATDLQLQSLAHGVIQLEQLAPSYGESRRRLRLIKLRGRQYAGGYHDFAIRPGGVVVSPRVRAGEGGSRAFVGPTLSSGLHELDALLAGGLDRGTSTLISGPAGTGKSLIATQFAIAAAERGEKSALFAFDERSATLFERARALNMPLERHVEAGLIHVQQIDPAEMSPGEFAQLACHVVDAGARLLAIDSLNGYLNAMTNERYLTVQLHELLGAFAQRGASTLLILGQHGVLGQMEAPVDLSYLSDTVLLLRYFESQGTIRKAISVVKKRSGPHENTIRELSVGRDGLRLGPPLARFRGVLSGVPQFFGDAAVLSEEG